MLLIRKKPEGAGIDPVVDDRHARAITARDNEGFRSSPGRRNDKANAGVGHARCCPPVRAAKVIGTQNIMKVPNHRLPGEPSGQRRNNHCLLGVRIDQVMPTCEPSDSPREFEDSW